MKYNVIEVLRALEACYVCDFNPILVDDFVFMFCERYGLDCEREYRRIRGMLNVLDKQKKITISGDRVYLSNMLRSGIKLYIKG